MSFRGLAIWGEPLYCENACRPEDIIIPPCREDTDKEAQMLRKERIEEIGRRYLDGHCPIILTASLRGPFTQQSGWSNPWKPNVTDKEEAVPESSYEESDDEVEEAHMGQAALQLVQERQNCNQQDEKPLRVSDVKDLQLPNKPLLPLEDEQFVSSHTNAILRAKKRPITAEWLKGANKSKKRRWETPDHGSPTPIAMPTSQRKRMLVETKTPPSKTSNVTPLASGSFNYVRLAAVKVREGKEEERNRASLKRKHSGKNDGHSDVDELAGETGIVYRKVPMKHRQPVSAQSAPRPSYMSQLSSKVIPLHSSQSTPQTRIPDLQEEFAARIDGSGLAKHFKAHWADLFAKQNYSSPVKSDSLGQLSKTQATPVPRIQATDEDHEMPEKMETEPAAAVMRQPESLRESDSGSHGAEEDVAQLHIPAVLEDISMTGLNIQNSQDPEAMGIDTSEANARNLQVGTELMDQHEQTGIQMPIEAYGATEIENRPDQSIMELKTTDRDMATLVHTNRSQTQYSQTRRLIRSTKRRRRRQKSREAKALTKETSVDRTKSLEAGRSATTTPKPHSQHAPTPDIIPSPSRSAPEARSAGDNDQNTHDLDDSVLQGDNGQTGDSPDGQLALRDAIDDKYVAEVTSQKFSTPAQSPKTRTLERPGLESQYSARKVQVDLRKSQERDSRAVSQPTFSKSIPQRKDTPDATPSEDELAISVSKQPYQRRNHSASKPKPERRASLKQSQESTVVSQRISASQQSSWHKSPKSIRRKWQPPVNAEASSDEDMEDIPARRPSSQVMEGHNSQRKEVRDGGDPSQKSVVPSQTQSQTSRRTSMPKTWQPRPNAVPSSDDDIGDIPARMPSQSTSHKSQNSARKRRPAREPSQSPIQTGQNPLASANGVHMSPMVSLTSGTASSRRSARFQSTPNASAPHLYTQSPWALTANVESLFVSVSGVANDDASHSAEAKQTPIMAKQNKGKHSTPEENFIRPISAFITPSPKKSSQTAMHKASFDPLLNPWVSTNASGSIQSAKKSTKRVSFAGMESASHDMEKDRLYSPPAEQKAEGEDIGGVGEKVSMFQERKKRQNSQDSQAPVWAYGEAFQEADGLVGAGVDGLLGADSAEGTAAEGGFDMQKFLREGEGIELDMPQEEYWDAEMYSGGRDTGGGVW